MEIHYPDYYKKFQCTGSRCQDTCCTGWRIGIDRKTCRKYRHARGEFRKRLRRSVDFRKRCFITDGQFCPFLNENKLCDIYVHMGKDSMCRTCRDYPRHMEIYGDIYEVSLSLSCPEAARLILEDEQPASFVKRIRDKRGKADEVDGEFLTLLCRIRSEIFEVMKDSSMSLNLRLAMILALAHDAQTRIDRGKPELADEVLDRPRREAVLHRFEKKAAEYGKRPEEKRRIMTACLQNMGKLDTIERSWPEKRNECRLFLSDKDHYEEIHNEFFDYYKKNEYEYRNLVIYFLYVYFLGAIYDGDIYGKVKLAVISCLFIQEMGAAVFARKKSFYIEDLTEAAYIYSREVEHSDHNLEVMDHILGSSGIFSLEKLMICVMTQ